MGEVIDLEPARPELGGEKPAYMPRIPWRWVALGTSVVIMFLTYAWLSERRRIEWLSAKIITVHDKQLSPVTRRYVALENKILTWTEYALAHPVVEALEKKTGKLQVEPQIVFAPMQKIEGLYAHIEDTAGADRKGIKKALLAFEGNSLAKCLGVTAKPVSELLTHGEFLLPQWTDEVRDGAGLMRLRVIHHQLSRHIDADLPLAAELMRSGWFLLAVERKGSNAVDAYLWDVRQDKMVFSTRTHPADAALLTVRLKNVNGPRLKSGALAEDLSRDCSLAAQIKSELP